MDISIVIPNFNGRHLLERNLQLITGILRDYKKETSASVEIIIVDDGSKDDSVDFLKRIHDSEVIISVFEHENNQGFSTTVNKGVLEAKGEIVILLNTDVIPEKDFLSPLIEHFKYKEVFAVGCLDKSIEHGKPILRGRGVGRWERGFLVHRRGEIDKKNTLWASGGSSAFKKSIWEKIGGLDPLYNPFYWEDIDLSYRAIKAGYSVQFEPKSVVTHLHEEGVIKTQFNSSKIKTIAYRNQLWFVWLNITDWDLLLKHVLWLPYHLLRSLVNKDKEFLIGFLKALIKLPVVLKRRSKHIRFARLTDKEIINANES